MLTLGIDARKRTHTIVAADQQGQQLAVKTVGTSTRDHLGLLTWAEKIAERAGDGSGLLWAIEDCRICRGGWNATCLPRARPSSGSRPSSWLTSGTPPGPWQVRPDRRDLPGALAPARTRPGLGTKTRSLNRISTLDQVEARIAGLEGTVARLAHLLASRCLSPPRR